MAKKTQHGGVRPGAGRKPNDPLGRAITIVATVPPGVAEQLDAVSQKNGWGRSRAIREAIHMLTTEQIRDVAIEYMRSRLQAAGWTIKAVEYRPRGVGFLAAEKSGERRLVQTTAQFDTDHREQQDVSDRRHRIMVENNCDIFETATISITSDGEITSEGIADVQRVILKLDSIPQPVPGTKKPARKGGSKGN